MTGSSACSDAVLLALAEARGPALVALGAGGAGDELTDDGVVALAASCRNLRALFLPNCAALTAASAEALQRQSTALRVAVFAGCPNVPLCHLHVGSPHRFGADAHLFIGGDGRGTFDPGSRPQTPKPRGYEQTPPSPPVMPPSRRGALGDAPSRKFGDDGGAPREHRRARRRSFDAAAEPLLTYVRLAIR